MLRYLILGVLSIFFGLSAPVFSTDFIVNVGPAPISGVPFDQRSEGFGSSQNGNYAIAAWNDNSTSSLFLSIFTSSSATWSTQSIFVGAANPPIVAIDDNKNAVAVWDNGTGSISKSVYNPISDTWSAIDITPAPPGFGFTSPRSAAICQVGNSVQALVTVLSFDFGISASVVQVLLYNNGIWLPLTPIEPKISLVISQQPVVSLTNNGNGWVSWYVDNNGTFEIRRVKVTPGTPLNLTPFFSDTLPNSSNISNVLFVRLTVINAAGDAVIAYGTDDTSTPANDINIYVSQSTLIAANNNPYQFEFGPIVSKNTATSMASGANSNAIFTAMTGNTSVAAATFSGGAWTIIPSFNVSSSSSEAFVTQDPSGNAYYINLTQTSSIEGIYYDGSSWGNIVPIDTTSNNILRGAAHIVNSSNQALVFSVQRNSGPNSLSIYTLLGLPKPVIDPPTNLQVETIFNQFLTQKERVNHITWNASPSPDIVSYRIYNNGVLIGEVPASQLYFNDPGIRVGVNYFYSVTAVNSSGLESTPITLFGPSEAPVGAPEPPVNLVAKNSTNHFVTQKERIITLTWEASPSPAVLKYRIYKNGSLIAEVSGASRQYIIQGVRAGQNDIYSVSAVNSLNLESTQLSVSGPLETPVGAPLPPEEFLAKKKLNNFLTHKERSILLTWKASPSPGVTHYRVYENGVLHAELPGSARSYTRQGARAGITYFFELVAVNSLNLESTPATATIIE